MSERNDQPETRPARILASKENAANCLAYVEDLRHGRLPTGEQMDRIAFLTRFDYLAAFLTACQRKLPTDKSYQREKQRRRT